MTDRNPKSDTAPYAADGSHLKQNALQWQDLAKRPLEELANFTLARPLPKGRPQFGSCDALHLFL